MSGETLLAYFNEDHRILVMSSRAPEYVTPKVPLFLSDSWADPVTFKEDSRFKPIPLDRLALLPPQAMHTEETDNWPDAFQLMASRFKELFVEPASKGFPGRNWMNDKSVHYVVSLGDLDSKSRKFAWYSQFGLYLPKVPSPSTPLR